MNIYSFANTVVLVNGREITGWDEGDDVIKVARLGDSATHKIGAGGEMMVSLSTDKSGEFTFKLQAGSDANNYLMELVKRQEAGASTFSPVNVLMQDTFRQDRGSAATCYMKKPSDMIRGAKAGSQEWVIVAENIDLVFGITPPVFPV